MNPPPFLRLPLELVARIALINIEGAEIYRDSCSLPLPESFSTLPEREEPSDPREITDPCVPFSACYTYRGAASNQATTCYLKRRPVDPVHINIYFVCRSTRLGLQGAPEIWRCVAFWYPALLPRSIEWISGAGTSDVVALAPFCLCVRPYLHKVVGKSRRLRFTMPYDGSFRPCDGIALCLMESNENLERLDMRFSLLEVDRANARSIICQPFPSLRYLRILNSHLIGYGNSLRVLHVGSETSCFRLPAYVLRAVLQGSPHLEELCLQRAIMVGCPDLPWVATLPRLQYFHLSDLVENGDFFRDHVVIESPSTHVDLVLGPHLVYGAQHVREAASHATRWATAFSSIPSTDFHVASLRVIPDDGDVGFTLSPEKITLALAHSCAEAAECTLPGSHTPRFSTSISKDVRNPHLEEYDIALDTYVPLFVTGVMAEMDLNAVDTLIFSVPSSAHNGNGGEAHIPDFVALMAILTVFDSTEVLVLPDIRGPAYSLHSLYDALSCCATEAVGREPDRLVREDFLLGKIRELVFPNWDAAMAPQRLVDGELEGRGRPASVGVLCATDSRG